MTLKDMKQALQQVSGTRDQIERIARAMHDADNKLDTAFLARTWISGEPLPWAEQNEPYKQRVRYVALVALQEFTR